MGAVGVSSTPTFEWNGTIANVTLEIYSCASSQGSGNLDLSTYTMTELPNSLPGERYVSAGGIAELSGLTYNPTGETSLFGILNKSPFSIVEFTKDGTVIRKNNIVSSVPSFYPNFTLSFDPEDIQWISSDNINHQFLIVDEETGTIYELDVPLTGNDDIDLSEPGNEAGKVSLIGNWGNNDGLEGISHDVRRNTILVAEEYSNSTVYEFDFPVSFDGSTIFNATLHNYSYPIDGRCQAIPTQEDSEFDISGLHHLSANSFALQMGVADRFLMISHEKEKIYETDMSGVIYSTMSFCALNELGIDDDFKLEGIAMDDEGDIYLTAEPNKFYKLENPVPNLNPQNIASSPLYTYNTNNTSFTLPETLVAGGEYCWRVIDNITGISSEYASFVVFQDPCVDIERPVLEEFMNSGIGNAQFWDPSIPINEWKGIKTNNSGCVTEIVLTTIPNTNGGTLPTDLGDLKFLELLHIVGQGLTGPLPSSMSELTALRHLDIGANALEGTINDQFNNKPNLEILSLGSNKLTGTIPASFQNLTSLRTLNLGLNLFSGEIWDKLYGLPELELVDFIGAGGGYGNGNGFSGEITSQISTIPKLRHIRLNANNFSGTLPTELAQLNQLEYLNILLNNFSGPLDSALQSLCGTIMQPYADEGNAFTCSWEDFCNSSCPAGLVEPIMSFKKSNTNNVLSDSLALVDLYNALDGPNWTIPWQLTQPINSWNGVIFNTENRVRMLLLSNRQLDGELPASICSLTELTAFIANSNQISGTIPPEIKQLQNLNFLDLSYNSLEGEIPHEVTQLHQLIGCSLNNNNLQGSIPYGFADLMNLESLYLNENNLEGSLPVDLHNMSNLKIMLLSHNRLAGTVYSTIKEMANIEYLDLSDNNFSGALPSEIGQLQNLKTLNVGRNNFSGPIPTEIGQLQNLIGLDVGLNNFSGPIPIEIGNLSLLKDLSFYGNRLSGSIPSNIADLVNLQTFFVAHNQLSGCYDEALQSLCINFANELFISDGNAFSRSWSEFCINQTNGCSNPTMPPGACPTDSLALISLYNATNGTTWTKSWNVNLPMSQWYGVRLHADGCVKSLDLANNKLDGFLPELLGTLSSIESLDLGNNSIGSTIPSQLGQLTNLTSLQLESNQLIGILPASFSALQSLKYFTVANNNLEGPIHVVSNWLDAEVISIYNNNFDELLPPNLAFLQSLHTLWLSKNNLLGCFDPAMATLCGQLHVTSSNRAISDGNHFDVQWEDFCSSGSGVCCQDNVAINDMIYTGFYQAGNEMDVMGIIPHSNQAVFQASEKVEFSAGFEVQEDGVFSVNMIGCQ